MLLPLEISRQQFGRVISRLQQDFPLFLRCRLTELLFKRNARNSPGLKIVFLFTVSWPLANICVSTDIMTLNNATKITQSPPSRKRLLKHWMRRIYSRGWKWFNASGRYLRLALQFVMAPRTLNCILDWAPHGSKWGDTWHLEHDAATIQRIINHISDYH